MVYRRCIERVNGFTNQQTLVTWGHHLVGKKPSDSGRSNGNMLHCWYLWRQIPHGMNVDTIATKNGDHMDLMVTNRQRNHTCERAALVTFGCWPVWFYIIWINLVWSAWYGSGFLQFLATIDYSRLTNLNVPLKKIII